MSQLINIGIVPIDNRPCNYDFVQDALKKNEHIQIEMFPKEHLGTLNCAGNLNKMASFIVEKAENIDYLIVSIDALCFGGLIQARQASEMDKISDFIQRLEVLKIAKEKNPNLKIYAYSVIMRLTISVNNENNIEQWERIFDYSRIKYLADHNEKYQDELDTVTCQIRPDLLETYINARKRNHRINLESIQYVEDGFIDYLSLIQEDSQKIGIQISEQEILSEKIKSSNLESKVTIKNGTDEMVCVLLSKVITSNLNRPSVYLYHDIQKDYIAKYEDRPVLENIIRIFEESGIQLINDFESADVVCVIFSKNSEQLDHVFEYDKLLNEEYAPIEDRRLKTKKICVLDLLNANGGKITDLSRFIHINQLNLNQIIGYNAWNTASNSVGTAAFDCALAGNGLVNFEYIIKRILDDGVYQGEVRNHLNPYVRTLDKNEWDIDAEMEKVTSFLKQEMNNAYRKYQKLMKLPAISIDYELPWDRTFEIRTH